MQRSRPLVRIDRLYSKGLTLIERDIAQIEKEGLVDLGSKLSSKSAKDLRDYLNLLGAMKEAQEAVDAERKARAELAAKTKSTEELERALTGAGAKVPSILTLADPALLTTNSPPTVPTIPTLSALKAP